MLEVTDNEKELMSKQILDMENTLKKEMRSSGLIRNRAGEKRSRPH